MRGILAIQRIGEVAETVVVFRRGRCGDTGRCDGGTTGSGSASLDTHIQNCRQRRTEERGSDERSDGPRHESVRGVAKVYFVGVQRLPANTKTPGQITADARCRKLRERNPEYRRNAERGGSGTDTRPRRYRRQSQSKSENDENERQCCGCSGSDKNRSPRHCTGRRISPGARNGGG